MKPVLTLVLFALYTITSGVGNAHAYSHDFASSTASKFHHQTTQLDNIARNSAIIRTSSDNHQVDEVVAIEEDDDQDELNKLVSAARCFIVFYYTFFVGDRYAMSIAHLTTCKPLYAYGSCKYITQRVLRI